MSVFVEAMRWENLAEDKEGGHCSTIWFDQVRFDPRCFWGRGRTDRALVFEDDVVATKRPAVVTGVEMVSKG